MESQALIESYRTSVVDLFTTNWPLIMRWKPLNSGSGGFFMAKPQRTDDGLKVGSARRPF
jgi:hypothetical protein